MADSFSVEPGYHALDLFLRTGHKPELLGKPNPQLYQHLLHTLGDPQPERILAIGDTLHTDILGARTVGMHTAVSRVGRAARPGRTSAHSAKRHPAALHSSIHSMTRHRFEHIGRLERAH